MARSGRDFDGTISTTSLSTRMKSPGLNGLGQLISPPAPMMPPAIGKHGECGRVPTAHGQTAEESSLRRSGAQMERLRIELPCKGGDLLLAYRMAPARKALAHKKIFKKQRVA